jgi:hypothetical protein
MQKVASFSLTGKIGAPPRRAAKLKLQKMTSFSQFSISLKLKIVFAPRCSERQFLHRDVAQRAVGGSGRRN